MKKSSLAFVPLLLVAMVVVVGCGKAASTSSGGGGNTVSMDASNFTTHAITIKAGSALKFDDSSGGYHVICLGKDQVCDQSAQGPAELMGQGFNINAPQTKDVIFATAGTYDVTCTVHPNMNVTVTVTA